MPETTISRFARASTLGTTLEISIGCEIWTCEDGRRNHHLEPLGGYVLECLPGASFRDQEGEITEVPARYWVYDPMVGKVSKAFRLIAEPEINKTSIDVPSTDQLVLAVRRLCREVGQIRQARGTRKRGSGILSGREIDEVRWAAALVKVIAAGPMPVAVERQLRKRETESEEW